MKQITAQQEPGQPGIQAARRVGGGLIVAAALNVSGLRAGAGTPTDAGSERPAGAEVRVFRCSFTFAEAEPET